MRGGGSCAPEPGGAPGSQARQRAGHRRRNREAPRFRDRQDRRPAGRRCRTDHPAFLHAGLCVARARTRAAHDDGHGRVLAGRAALRAAHRAPPPRRDVAFGRSRPCDPRRRTSRPERRRDERHGRHDRGRDRAPPIDAARRPAAAVARRPRQHRREGAAQESGRTLRIGGRSAGGPRAVSPATPGDGPVGHDRVSPAEVRPPQPYRGRIRDHAARGAVRVRRGDERALRPRGREPSARTRGREGGLARGGDGEASLGIHDGPLPRVESRRVHLGDAHRAPGPGSSGRENPNGPRRSAARSCAAAGIARQRAHGARAL